MKQHTIKPIGAGALVLVAIAAIFLLTRSAEDTAIETWEITDLLAADVQGDVDVIGTLFDDGGGLVLCEFLAESFPPQCPGPSIKISNPDDVVAEFTTSGAVRWTDRSVTLRGEVVEGELTVDASTS